MRSQHDRKCTIPSGVTSIKPNRFVHEQDVELPELDLVIQSRIAAKPHMWTKKEELILRKYYPNPKLTANDVAKVMNRSVDSIHAKATKLGLKKDII